MSWNGAPRSASGRPGSGVSASATQTRLTRRSRARTTAGGAFVPEIVPAWAGELGVSSWAQLCLKFIFGDARIQFAIPATGRLDHLQDFDLNGRLRFDRALVSLGVAISLLHQCFR